MKLENIVDVYCYENVLSPDTVRTYYRRAKAFECRVKYKSLNELTRDRVLRWRDELLGEGKKHTTVNNYLRHNKVIWQFAMERGFAPIGENIFAIPKLPETVSKRVISDATLSEALAQLSPKTRWFWQAVINVQAELGIRNRQLVNIRVKDVCMDRKLVYCRAEGNKMRQENVLPLSKQAHQALQIYFDSSRIAIVRDLNPHEYLFDIARYDFAFKSSPQGQMSTEQLQGVYHRLSKRVSAITGERISGHRLRHTLATRIGSRPDINIRVVQEWFGWRNIHTAQRYVQVSLDQKRALIEEA